MSFMHLTFPDRMFLSIALCSTLFLKGFIQTCDPAQEIKYSRVAQKRVCYVIHVNIWVPQTQGTPHWHHLWWICSHHFDSFVPTHYEIACSKDGSNTEMTSPFVEREVSEPFDILNVFWAVDVGKDESCSPIHTPAIIAFHGLFLF